MTHIGSDVLSELVEHACGRQRLLFLDYDGTLVPFAEKPHLARPDEALLELLALLSARADTTVHIVTGRSRTSIDGWLGHLPIGLHAEHGQWTRPPASAEWSARSTASRDWLEEARILMNATVVSVPGSMVEEKESGIAWHYRLADHQMAASGGALLHALAQPLCVRHGLELLPGEKVIELRKRGVHKGHVVRELVNAHAGDAFVLAVGDDVTDDDMFAALPAGAFAIAAASRPRSAHFRVDGHDAVRSFLRRLCDDPISCVRLRGSTTSEIAT